MVWCGVVLAWYAIVCLGALRGQKTASDIPGDLSGCCDGNSGSLKDQPALITPEPSLQCQQQTFFVFDSH